MWTKNLLENIIIKVPENIELSRLLGTWIVCKIRLQFIESTPYKNKNKLHDACLLVGECGLCVSAPVHACVNVNFLLQQVQIQQPRGARRWRLGRCSTPSTICTSRRASPATPFSAHPSSARCLTSLRRPLRIFPPTRWEKKPKARIDHFTDN